MFVSCFITFYVIILFLNCKKLNSSCFLLSIFFYIHTKDTTYTLNNLERVHVGCPLFR